MHDFNAVVNGEIRNQKITNNKTYEFILLIYSKNVLVIPLF